MGICIARFQESENVARWGVVEDNLVMHTLDPIHISPRTDGCLLG